jgi:hypothetical protein
LLVPEVGKEAPKFVAADLSQIAVRSVDEVLKIGPIRHSSFLGQPLNLRV